MRWWWLLVNMTMLFGAAQSKVMTNNSPMWNNVGMQASAVEETRWKAKRSAEEEPQPTLASESKEVMAAGAEKVEETGTWMNSGLIIVGVIAGVALLGLTAFIIVVANRVLKSPRPSPSSPSSLVTGRPLNLPQQLSLSSSELTSTPDTGRDFHLSSTFHLSTPLHRSRPHKAPSFLSISSTQESEIIVSEWDGDVRSVTSKEAKVVPPHSKAQPQAFLHPRHPAQARTIRNLQPLPSITHSL